MAVPLSASLTAHQRSARRQPSLSLSLAPTRFGIPRVSFTPTAADDAEPSAPIAALNIFGSAIYRFRNNAGSLEYDTGAGWTNVDTVTAGQGLAVAIDPVAAVILLVYGDGTALKLRTSADSFASATTLVTEASAIGSVALAVKASTGNACAFYTLGTTTTLKRLRRTTGTWAGSGTTWSKTGDVASITGLTAVHNGNFYLAVTGTEVTTTHEKLWAVAMGDGPIASNTWSSFVTIAEADAAASLTFGFPSLALIGNVYFCCFQQVEAGNVAASRLMLTSTTESAGPLAHWTEPFPTFQLSTSHGAALSYDSGAFVLGIPSAILVGPSQTALWTQPDSLSLGAKVVSCSWRETPNSLKVRIELAANTTYVESLSDSARVLGWDATLTHGFNTAEGFESGILLRANIARVTRRFAPGKASIVLECDGPWEALARYRAPQAWTAPSGYLRSQIFNRVAGRAGIEAEEAGTSRAPSAIWSAAPSGFAIAAGERGSTTLDRLLEPTPDFARIQGTTGVFQICGGFAVDETATVPEEWSIPAFEHPLTELAVFEQHQPNWIRLQGPDRYADAFYFDGLLTQDLDSANFPIAPIMDHVRDFSADDDTKASTAAADALLRRQWLTPFAELTAPANLSVELFDVIAAGVLPADGHYELLLPGVYGRVISRGVDYRTGPTGKAEYQSVLTLGRVTYP